MTQRSMALKKANEHRMIQASLKRMLRKQSLEAGKLMVIEVVSDPAPELAAMRIEALIRGVRTVGQDKSLRMLRRANVSPTRRVGDLTFGERTRLESVLG